MEVYKDLIDPWLETKDSEEMHAWARDLLRVADIDPLGIGLKIVELVGTGRFRFSDPRLNVVLGENTPNPVYLDNPTIIGAGWDKYGVAIPGLYHLGAAATEFGTVPYDPQVGNDEPRQEMLAPGVTWNWLGFNSPGVIAVVENLVRGKYKERGYILGGSIGINKTVKPEDAPEAHAKVTRLLLPHVSYIAMNISSPNTVGLRRLQTQEFLKDNIQAVYGVMTEMGIILPFYIKVSPDETLEVIDGVAQVVIDEKATGIIANNTTADQSLKAKYDSPDLRIRQAWGSEWIEKGGLAGDDPEFRRRSTALVAHIYREFGQHLEIIGVGGIKDAQTAWEKITAGAKAIQVVSAIRGEGPGVAKNINQGLVRILDQEDVSRLQTVVGIFANKY